MSCNCRQRCFVLFPIAVLTVVASLAQAAPPRLADLERATGTARQAIRLDDGGTAEWRHDHPFGDTVGNRLTVVAARQGGWWCRQITPGPNSPIDLSWHAWTENDDVTAVLEATARWYPKRLYLRAPNNVGTLLSDSVYFGFPGVFRHSIATPQMPAVGGTWKLDGWYLRQRGPVLHPEGLCLRVYPEIDGPAGHHANFNQRITVEVAGTGPDDRPISERLTMFRYDGKSSGKATSQRFKTLSAVTLIGCEHDKTQDDHFAGQGITLPAKPVAMGVAISGPEVFHFLENDQSFTLRVKDDPHERGLLFYLIDPIEVKIGGPRHTLSFHGGVDDLAWGRCNQLERIGTWALQVPTPQRYGSLAWGIVSVGRFGAGIPGERVDFAANVSHPWNSYAVAIEASEQGHANEGIARMRFAGHWRDGSLFLRNMHREGLSQPVEIDSLVLESTTDPYWDGTDFRRRGKHGWGVRNTWPTIGWWELTGLHTVEHQVADWQPVGASGSTYPPAAGVYPGCWAYRDPNETEGPMYLGGGYLFDVLIQSRGALAEPKRWEAGDDLSQIIFRIEGTDQHGLPVSRELRGPPSNEVTRTDRVFQTVTRAMAVRVPEGQESRRVAMTRGPKMLTRGMDPPRIGGTRTPVVGRVVLRGGKTGMGVFNMSPNVDVVANPSHTGLDLVFDRPGQIIGTDTMMQYIASIDKQDGTTGTTPTRRVKFLFTQTPESTYAPRWMYQAGGTGASFQHATFVYKNFRGSLASYGCDGPKQIMADIEHTGTIDYATFRFPTPATEKGPSFGQPSGLVVYGRSRAHQVVAPMLVLNDFSSRYQVLCDTTVEDLTILPARQFPDQEGKIHVNCHPAHPSIADEPVATNVTVRRVVFSDGRSGLAPAGDLIVLHRWNARPIGIGGKGPLVFDEVRIAPGSRIVVQWEGKAPAWKAGTTYHRYDVVSRGGGMVYCTVGHAAAEPFDADQWAPFDTHATNISLVFNGTRIDTLPHVIR